MDTKADSLSVSTVHDEHETSFDIIVIGAGISGINAGYRIQSGLPGQSYCILESRNVIGGTWSFFKYPGLRSDSDLHTFGFPWEPWNETQPIATADKILNYLTKTAAKHGIDQHIKFNHSVSSADWSSDVQKWRLTVDVASEGKPTTKSFYSKFLLLGTGYYNYEQSLPAVIPGIEHFKGQVIHPQFWPENYDYTGKRVVIIGSGATAATILPAMAEKAARVTMLQRSPSYFLIVPQEIGIDNFIRRWAPARWAHQLVRWRFLVVSYLFVNFCLRFPSSARNLLRRETVEQLPPNIPVDPHFNPSYPPWKQRMCMTPGGDFFQALRGGKAEVVTDHIDTVTSEGVKLKSAGQILPADVIVTATGLKLQTAGGARITIDGTPVNISDKYTWNGTMLQDVPNLIYVFGYTTNSWTLGADATARLFVRLYQNMQRRGMTSVVPRVDPATEVVTDVPFLNLNSTYVKAAAQAGVLPKGGSSGPWRPRSQYIKDWWMARWGNIDKGLVFERVAT